MIKNAIFIIFSSFLISSCHNNIPKETSLKDVFKNDFLIGVALSKASILEEDSIANSLIKNEFNSITAENIMKSKLIHPGFNHYDFPYADRFVEYGEKNKQYIVGHTLIWHSQLSEFVKDIKNPDSMNIFMEDHINTIVGRYKGRVNSWDVVNEALNEDGSYRESEFYNLLGKDYIKYAFQLAENADPNVELYYNDYFIEKPEKRKGAIRIIKELKEAGIRIDGVGIQGHWHINDENLKNIEDAIIEFTNLGVKVAFTELDYSVLPDKREVAGGNITEIKNDDPRLNPYVNGLPDSIQNVLAKRYEDIFKLFLKHKDKISRVTFWGVSDGLTWLNYIPIKGRTNYPLLFDRNYKPKKAYYSIKALKNN